MPYSVNPSTGELEYKDTAGSIGAVTNIDVDAFLAPGTDPVDPDLLNHNVILTGGQVVSGTVGANVLRSFSAAANTVSMQIQQAGSSATEDTSKNGVAHFNSSHFSVSHGFVSLAGGGQGIDSFSTDLAGPISADVNGNVALSGSTNIYSDGSVANAVHLNLQGTNHALFVGRGANTASASLSTGTAGQILQSGGAAADPAWSTATYPAATGTSGTVLQSNGTNWLASTPTYPTTAGTSGKILVSNGTNFVSSTPTFPNASATAGKIIQSDGTNWVESTPTYPTTAGTSGKILVSNGTNFVSSTPTFPNASATAGKMIQSDGTNWLASTPTYPTTATGTGTILRADGTNWSATTATYPNTSTANQLLYSSAINTIAGLATGNNGVLTTSGAGVPSIDTTNFQVLTTGVQMKGNNANTAPPAGFIGEYITDSTLAFALSNATPANVASITLTPGIWNISTICYITNSGNMTLVKAGPSPTSATFVGSAGADFAQFSYTATAISIGLTAPVVRVNLSANTTYYLVAQSNFTTGTSAANGRISATRVG